MFLLITYVFAFVPLETHDIIYISIYSLTTVSESFAGLWMLYDSGLLGIKGQIVIQRARKKRSKTILHTL